MRVDLGLILAIMLEYILFILYADTLFERKRNRWICYGIVAIGFALHFVVCMFGNTVFNTVTSFANLFLCLILCYDITYKNALFQSAILVVLRVASEYCIVPFLNILPFELVDITPAQSMVLTLTSGTIYLITVMLLSHFLYREKQKQISQSIWLVVIPIVTIVIFLLVIQTNMLSYLLSVSCFLLTIINVAVFIINQTMINKEQKIIQLQDAERRQELEDLYNKVCGIRHDLKNHFMTINTLIDENPQRAKEYIKSLTQNQLQSIIRFVRTDNACFNAITNAKIAICEREGIHVQTRIQNNALSRLTDDEISILFGNLFDNAIEATRQTEDRQINLDIAVQDAYLSIIMTNSVKSAVLADNKALKTTKRNKTAHGYGTKNISRIVKKHGGILNYFDENGLFGCQILI